LQRQVILPLPFLLPEAVEKDRFMDKRANNCALYTKMRITFCDAQIKWYKYFKILNIKSKN